MINKRKIFNEHIGAKGLVTFSSMMLFSFLMFGVFTFSSCSEKPPTEEKVEDTSSSFQTEAPAGLTPANTSPAATAASGSGVAHFTCPNNCDGSGGAIQTNCPICGTAYVHNKAYHDQPGIKDNATPELIQMNAPGGQQAAPGTGGPTSQSQNAAGVWHFTCAAGCEGGAGNKGPCGSCGQPLSHNQAYHQ